MKYLIALILFCAVPHYEVLAQDTIPDYVLKEELKTGKAVLVYCYTTWCKPCAKMSKEVFSRKDVRDYLDKKFIVYKVDMESVAGVKYKEKYNVTNYPMFLIFRKGVMVYKFIGGYNAEAFLEKLKKSEATKK